MKTTRYFEEQVLRKRPYIDRDWCTKIISAPFRSEVQEGGRVRFWGEIVDPRDGVARMLRVVTLDFFDRGFRKDRP